MMMMMMMMCDDDDDDDDDERYQTLYLGAMKQHRDTRLLRHSGIHKSELLMCQTHAYQHLPAQFIYRTSEDLL
eukprot:2906091-Amphidinium_carterae.1